MAMINTSREMTGKRDRKARFFTSPKRILLYIALVLFTILWTVPILVAIGTAFRTNSDILLQGGPFSLPKELVLTNFQAAWQRGGLSRYIPNSFIITFPSLFLTLFLSSMSAYALARFRFRGHRLIFALFIAGNMLPFQVLMLPVFRLTDALGLYDTYWALILFHTAFQLGFCTFVLRNYMRTIPGEMLEAARIDGCGEFRIYWQIMLPLVLPAMAAVATLEFTWIFNDYLWAIVLLRSDALKPIAAGLALLQGQYIQDWTVIIAGALMGTLPTMVVFIFLQRYFLGGLTLGSTK
ncbi:MAG: carbohydrate ABC transporter permease [Anaerolineae bacterium]|nr:carbohydrate ABC transporter permease [Anaerolineae bacterium]